MVGTCTRPCVAEKPPCEPRPAACRGPRGEAASCRGKAARGEAAYNLVIVICRQPCALHIFLYTVHHPRWGRSSLYLVRRDTIVFRGEYPPLRGGYIKGTPAELSTQMLESAQIVEECPGHMLAHVSSLSISMHAEVMVNRHSHWWLIHRHRLYFHAKFHAGRLLRCREIRNRKTESDSK